MRTLSFLMLVSVFLVPTLEAQQQLGGAPLIAGFNVLTLPRRNVPVGAIWQQGLGPTGGAVPAAALRFDSSASIMTSNDEFKAASSASIFRWIGLSGAAQRATLIEFHDVQIVTVRDLAMLRLQSDNDVLYEAVRVGTMHLRTNKSRRGEVVAVLATKVSNDSIQFTARDSSLITVRGTNLFVAYRVVTLRSPKVSRDRQKVRKSDQTFQLRNYSFSWQVGAYLGCACQKYKDRDAQADHDQLHRCDSDRAVRLYVDDPAGGLFADGGASAQFNVAMHRHGPPSVFTIASGEKSGRFYVDRVIARVQPVVFPAATNTGACVSVGKTFFNDKSEVELLHIEYPFSPLQRPQAKGW